MKKIFYVVFSFLLALSITACSYTPDPENDKLPIATQTPNPGTAAPDAAADPTAAATENSTSAVSINEQIIYDKDGIRVTVLGLTQDDFWGPAVKVLVENTSAENITVQLRNSSVNDLMLDPMFSCDVAAGKKANDTITFMQSDLDASGISVIAKIEFVLHIFNSDTWNDIGDSDIIVLQTSAADHVQTYHDSGFVACDDSNIKIVIQKLNSEDSFWGSDVYVYAENNTDSNITIQARDVSIDGFMVDPLFSCDVAAGKKAYDTITFLESDLEKNNITNIKELELYLTVFDSDNWKDILNTDIITVTFE